MILVTDAAPLIFLAKIHQLQLLTNLFDADILVPSAVYKEILGKDVPPDEEKLLITFLSGCRVVNLRKPMQFAKALSFADNCIMTLAIKEKANIILSDDRLLRRIALLEDFQVVGTIGILLRAVKASLLTAQESKNFLAELVAEHNFRISTRVYDAACNF